MTLDAITKTHIHLTFFTLLFPLKNSKPQLEWCTTLSGLSKTNHVAMNQPMAPIPVGPKALSDEITPRFYPWASLNGLITTTSTY